MTAPAYNTTAAQRARVLDHLQARAGLDVMELRSQEPEINTQRATLADWQAMRIKKGI